MQLRSSIGAPRLQSEPAWIAMTAAGPDLEPLAWTAGQPEVSVFWEVVAEGCAAVGFGAVDSLEASDEAGAFQVMEALCAPGRILWAGDGPRPPGPWFGGLAFDLCAPAPGGWPGFPATRWVLPSLLVWRREGQTWLTAFGRRSAAETLEQAEHSARARLARALEAAPPRPPARAGGASLEVSAARGPWELLVSRALGEIATGGLTKVVLARGIEARPREGRLDPITVLHRLREEAPGGTLFAFWGQQGTCFLGATPEVLCRVQGDLLESEALAGTGTPGAEAALLASDKDAREHRVVAEAIEAGLRPLCVALEVASVPELLRLPGVVHLRTPFRGRLRPGVGVADVVRALHPTPAVGGFPRDRALSFLRRWERLERGWYAGAVGWLGEGAADLRVALRSALLGPEGARLFVGAGVVAGSSPEGEWDETHSKGRALLRALGGGS